MNANAVVVLTAEQLKEFAEKVVMDTIKALNPSNAEVQSPLPDDRYVYGLRGIGELFGVSKSTAQQYKNTFLAPAVEQRGRKFRINVRIAGELYAAYKSA